MPKIKNEDLIPPSSIIKKQLYLFIYSLMKSIILKNTEEKNDEKSNQMKKEKLLNEFIDKINNELINKNKHINKEYTIENLKNILDYIKSQNRLLAGDILEGILIKIFSLAFKTSKVNTFYEFLYKDNEGKYKLEESKNLDLDNWFVKDIFLPNELKNLKNLIENDDKNEKTIKKSILYQILYEILKVKYINPKEKNKNKKIDEYIYRRNFNFQNMLDINFTMNFEPKKIIRYFLISVFIYYQNKNSPLMKYTYEYKEKGNKKEENKNKENNIKMENNNINENENKDENEKKDLSIIPFDYNLNEAQLNLNFANAVFSPIRIEPRINKITFTQNNFMERGFFEFSKSLLFNKNIKRCILDTSFIKSFYLDYLNLGLGIYDNYNLEELNLSYNLMNKDSEEFLANIISHLKGLKTINLSSNELKKGLAPFFDMLKLLYRQGKTKLENLVINKCQLDNSAFYELGELLKCKFCNLKRLYLNINTIPSQVHFLKKLKKNKCLTEIYLNKTNINEKDTDDIMRLISNTHIETLYLYKTKIVDFNDCLRILYRTKLVTENDEKEVLKEESFLSNIDLSDNNILNKNVSHIELLENIINETTLYSLDLSHILLGNNPEKNQQSSDNQDYRNAIKILSDSLNKKIEDYNQKIWDIKCLKFDKEQENGRLEELKKEMNDYKENNFENLINKISPEMWNNENAIYPLYLREKAKEIITNIVSYNGIYDEFKEKIKKNLIVKANEEEEKKKEEDFKNKKKIEIKDEDTVNFDEYKKLENFFLYQMTLNRIEKELKENKDIKKNRKLIII